jgi:hypothetical protein
MKWAGLSRLALALMALSILVLGAGQAMAIEEARYTVLEREDNFELRQYQPQIVAETLVEGNFQEVGNAGFRRLYDYISGKNRKQQAIPMTAPVSQEKVGEKWRITFLMPARYTLETLPAPLDPQVRITQIPGRLMAALSYSGTWSQARYAAREKELKDRLGRKGLKIAGEPVFARYNPPFLPWFLRRNEVLIPVAR